MKQTVYVTIVSTADCERGFSLLKLVKTPLRNAYGAVNLNSAMQVFHNGICPFSLFLYPSQKAIHSKEKKSFVIIIL